MSFLTCLYSFKYSYQIQIIGKQIHLTQKWDPNRYYHYLEWSGSNGNGRVHHISHISRTRASTSDEFSVFYFFWGGGRGDLTLYQKHNIFQAPQTEQNEYLSGICQKNIIYKETSSVLFNLNIHLTVQMQKTLKSRNHGLVLFNPWIGSDHVLPTPGQSVPRERWQWRGTLVLKQKIYRVFMKNAQLCSCKKCSSLTVKISLHEEKQI